MTGLEAKRNPGRLDVVNVPCVFTRLSEAFVIAHLLIFHNAPCHAQHLVYYIGNIYYSRYA
jgi:hypothetical protein